MDGVKSWLSKSKGSAKNLSDDGSLKSSSPPGRRLYGFPGSDEEEEEEEKEEGGATRSSYYSRYRYGSHVKDNEREDTPYESTPYESTS